MSAKPPAAVKKKMQSFIRIIIIVGAVLVLAMVIGGAVAWFIANRLHADDEEGGIFARRDASPTFLPLENMVINLADPGGERVAQIGITLELENAKAADRIKQHLPVIRNAILLLVSQRHSAELLQRDGKEKLAVDILREASRPLGYPVLAERECAATVPQSQQEPQEDAHDRAVSRHTDRNPVQRVLFSSFIIQ